MSLQVAARASTPAQRGVGGGIRISDLCKTYVASGQTTEALRNINLDIKPGEFIVLLGRSGCGKSTLLRMLGGLLSPTSGSITFDGKPLYDESQKLNESVLVAWASSSRMPTCCPGGRSRATSSCRSR
jgi:ABC-type multidrug transport system ATPase subunit